MRALVLVTLLGCSGRVEAVPVGDAAPGDTSLVGSCVAQLEVGTCDARPDYFPVDPVRRCVDRSAPGFATCVCKRTSVDCIVDQDSGVVFLAPCSGPRPPGYCDCGEALYAEMTALPYCP